MKYDTENKTYIAGLTYKATALTISDFVMPDLDVFLISVTGTASTNGITLVTFPFLFLFFPFTSFLATF